MRNNNRIKLQYNIHQNKPERNKFDNIYSTINKEKDQILRKGIILL